LNASETVKRPAMGDRTLLSIAAVAPPSRWHDYAASVLVVPVVLVVRAALNPFVEGEYLFVLALLGVVFISWRGGFGPAIVTLLLSTVGMYLLFVRPHTQGGANLGGWLATAMFFFCGVCCAALGQAHWSARRKARSALTTALERKADLELEVARRREAEIALRQRETALREVNQHLELAQQQTVEAFAQVESLVHNAPVGIALLDNALRLVRMNRVFADCVQLGMSEPNGKTIRELEPHFPAELVADCEQVLESREASLDRRLAVNGNGSGPALWQISVYPVVGSAGRSVGLGVIALNVTERERAADALRESEQRFRSLADSVPILIWVADHEHKRNYFNKTWLQFTGRSLQEESGDHWTANIHPDDVERHLGLYNAAFDSREPFESEYRLRRHDGEYRWMLARGAPRFTPGGEFVGFCGLCLDVTDRKRSEQDVRASEARYRELSETIAASEKRYRSIGERFRTLTEMIPQMVWTANPRGELTFVNQRWAAYTGREFDLKSPSEKWLELVHPEDVEAFRQSWHQTVAEDQRDFQAEMRLRSAVDGDYLWMRVSAVSVRDASGVTTE
jgi:PAS domain S-box-containing protein